MNESGLFSCNFLKYEEEHTPKDRDTIQIFYGMSTKQSENVIELSAGMPVLNNLHAFFKNILPQMLIASLLGDK